MAQGCQPPRPHRGDRGPAPGVLLVAVRLDPAWAPPEAESPPGRTVCPGQPPHPCGGQQPLAVRGRPRHWQAERHGALRAPTGRPGSPSVGGEGEAPIRDCPRPFRVHPSVLSICDSGRLTPSHRHDRPHAYPSGPLGTCTAGLAWCVQGLEVGGGGATGGRRRHRDGRWRGSGFRVGGQQQVPTFLFLGLRPSSRDPPEPYPVLQAPSYSTLRAALCQQDRGALAGAITSSSLPLCPTLTCRSHPGKQGSPAPWWLPWASSFVKG